MSQAELRAVSVLPRTSSETLGTLLHFSKLSFLIWKMGIISDPFEEFRRVNEMVFDSVYT